MVFPRRVMFDLLWQQKFYYNCPNLVMSLITSFRTVTLSLTSLSGHQNQIIHWFLVSVLGSDITRLQGIEPNQSFSIRCKIGQIKKQIFKEVLRSLYQKRKNVSSKNYSRYISQYSSHIHFSPIAQPSTH